MNKAQRIRTLMAKHPELRPMQVAEKLGLPVKYVHTVRYLDRRSPLSVAPTPVAPAPVAPTPVIDPVVILQQEDKIRAYRKQIDDMLVVIAYLEKRCARAEELRGPTV